MRVRILALVIAVAACAAAARAGTREEGPPSPLSVLTARVTDRAGKPIPFAEVILSGEQYACMTRRDGTGMIRSVPPGVYDVRVIAIGYEDSTIVAVRFATGDTARIAVRLRQRCHKRRMLAADIPLLAERAGRIQVFLLARLDDHRFDARQRFEGTPIESPWGDADTLGRRLLTRLLEKADVDTCCEALDSVWEPRFGFRFVARRDTLDLSISNDLTQWQFMNGKGPIEACEDASLWSDEILKILRRTYPDSVLER